MIQNHVHTPRSGDANGAPRRQTRKRFVQLGATLIVAFFLFVEACWLVTDFRWPVPSPPPQFLRQESSWQQISPHAADAFQAQTTLDSSPYDYTAPVPLAKAVDPAYFEDAVFLGDSRTQGFILSTGLSTAASFADKGLMVNTVFTKPVVPGQEGKISAMEALKETKFSKVYIMLGINETGWSYSSVFIEQYNEIIDAIQASHPFAQIYVQSILPVSKTVSDTHAYVHNSKIAEYNQLLQQMAAEQHVYYVNVAECLAQADGSLPESAAVDGIHLKKDQCLLWLEYLKTHTVPISETAKGD